MKTLIIHVHKTRTTQAHAFDTDIRQPKEPVPHHETVATTTRKMAQKNNDLCLVTNVDAPQDDTHVLVPRV